MPSIAFGTWKMGNGDGPIFQVDQAIHTGFNHVGELSLTFPLYVP
jgi:diketogulonate reductase-like aldo/keto reductase